MPELTMDDAAFAVALGVFVEGRGAHGERVSCRAAERIAAMAAVIRIRPVLGLADLGFALEGDCLKALSPKAKACAYERLAGTPGEDRVNRLSATLKDLTVADVEGYEEPQPIQPSWSPANGATEWVFRAGALPNLPDEAEPGLLVVATTESPALKRLCGNVWVADKTLQAWVTLHRRDSPEQLLELRRTEGVLALIVRCGTELGLPATLAVAFARHLQLQRAVDGTPSAPAVVMSTGMEPLPGEAGLEPVLHLLTREAWPQDGSTGLTGLTDAALWEWMSPDEIRAWYGAPPPDARTLHDQVTAVLALRRAAREGRLGDSPDAQALMAALQGRTFDGRFALQHHELLERLLGQLRDGSP